MTSTTSNEPSHAVLEQAAQWYAELRDGQAGSQTKDAWQSWLQASEEHRIAWRYVEEISSSLEPLRGMPDPRDAANQLCSVNNRLNVRRRTLAGIALLAGGGMLGWLGWRNTLLPANLIALAADYSTDTGEQREITLADGTRLWLNTASAINIRFTSQERRVVLMTGEIFIITAGNAVRPFLVDTVHGQMRALGTRFNVHLDGGETRLAVFEGAVEISTATTDETAIISAGQQANFTAVHIREAQSADQARAAWTQGMLVVENIALRDVVRELRRYRKGHLGISDKVADLAIYGNFPIRDTDQVLDMLASVLPIRIHRPYPWWTSIEAKPEA